MSTNEPQSAEDRARWEQIKQKLESIIETLTPVVTTLREQGYTPNFVVDQEAGTITLRLVVDVIGVRET